MRSQRFLFSCALLLFTTRLYAWPILPPAPAPGAPSGIILGVEPTFTNRELRRSRIDDDALLEKRQRIVNAWEHLIETARPGDLFYGATLSHSIRTRNQVPETTITFPANPALQTTGFSFSVFTDPHCLESNMTPATVQQYRRRLPYLNTLFRVMAENGVHADPLVGGGHVHIDMQSAFHDNALAYRNFLALMHGNQWMADGGLRYPVPGGPSNEARLLSLEQLRELGSNMREWDRYFHDPNTPWRIQDKLNIGFMVDIVRRIYGRSPAGFQEEALRKHALNVNNANGHLGFATTEYRGISAFQTPEEMVRILEMFDAMVSIAKEAASQGKTIGLIGSPAIRAPGQALDFNNPEALRAHATQVREQFARFMNRPDLQGYESFRRLREVFRLDTPHPWLPFEHLTPPGETYPYTEAMLATRPAHRDCNGWPTLAH